MGNSTSTADITQLKNTIASIQTTINGLNQKVDNFQASTVDYTQLGNSLINTSDNLNKITNGIINSPDKLASALTPGLIANAPFVNSINQSISKNTDFTKSVSNLITSDATFRSILKGDKGDPGNIGDYTALKANLYGSTLTGAKNPATLWCADGDFCQVPVGSKGIIAPSIQATSNVVPSSQGAYIVWNRDGSSGMTTFANQRGGGPGGFEFVNFDKNNNVVNQAMTINGSGQVAVKNGLVIGGWTIFEDSTGKLVFQRPGGDQNAPNTGLVMFNADGNVWTNRSTAKGWIPDNIGNINDRLNNGRIQTTKSGQCIDSSGGGGNRGTNLNLWDCNGDDGQHYRWIGP